MASAGDPAQLVTPQTEAAVAAMQPPSANRAQVQVKSQPQPIPTSHPRYLQQSHVAGSPSRLRSSSPRLHSPASSEIFERNVQEPAAIPTLQSELSPAHIPTHVITEDFIPPALEASAQAITSEELNPDEVEIVMSSSHQPAAASVLEGSTSFADLTTLQSPISRQKSNEVEPALSLYQSGIMPSSAEEDGASNYGSLDPNDVRRLSFISFADVVQSEHQQAPASAVSETGHRDGLHMMSGPTSAANMTQERAASPFRSPRSPISGRAQGTAAGVVTPPLPGVNMDPANTEQSPVRSIGVGSSVGQHGELTIETMRQAVRKTASGDLSGVRNAGMSPTSEDTSSQQARSRTNS